MLTDALVENRIADLETRLKQPPFDLRAYFGAGLRSIDRRWSFPRKRSRS